MHRPFTEAAQWPSGLERWLGLATGRFHFPAGFESHCGKLLLRNFGNSVYPALPSLTLPVSFGGDTKTPSSTSTLYSAPSYSRIMRRHCVCGGLLVGKSVQEVWEKKRKKGKIVINKKFTGKIKMKKKEENKPNIKNKKTSYCGG